MNELASKPNTERIYNKLFYYDLNICVLYLVETTDFFFCLFSENRWECVFQTHQNILYLLSKMFDIRKQTHNVSSNNLRYYNCCTSKIADIKRIK